MKGLIIENEYFVPAELEGFIKDNPELFPNGIDVDVDVKTSCLHRKMEDIARFIPDADAIIVMSTFMYKDQLENYVAAFASGKFGKKKFYCYRFEANANEFLLTNSKYLYMDLPALKENLKKLFLDHEVYDIVKDDESETVIHDEFWDGASMMINLGSGARDRKPYKAVRLLYHPELNIVYHEGTDPKETYEDRKHYIKD